MDGISLNRHQRCRLQHALGNADDAAQCRRILAILEIDAGKSVADVAELLGVSRQCVYNWIENYAAHHDPEDLVDRERSGRPSRWTKEVQSLVRECLRWPPDSWGYQAVSWTVPLLQNWLAEQTGLMFSESTIRQHLHQLGYAWKRSRYVLQSDPQREKKTANLPQNSAISPANRSAV